MPTTAAATKPGFEVPRRTASSLLTEVAIKAAKPAVKAYPLSDKNGLFLLVSPTGSKLWRWKYRVAGKEKLMAFGASSVQQTTEHSLRWLTRYGRAPRLGPMRQRLQGFAESSALIREPVAAGFMLYQADLCELF